jgi:hypothetical protein
MGKGRKKANSDSGDEVTGTCDAEYLGDDQPEIEGVEEVK